MVKVRLVLPPSGIVGAPKLLVIEGGWTEKRSWAITIPELELDVRTTLVIGKELAVAAKSRAPAGGGLVGCPGAVTDCVMVPRVVAPFMKVADIVSVPNAFGSISNPNVEAG